MRRERERSFTIRLDDTELAMAHALAEREDAPASVMFRRWLRDHWRAAYGDAAPPATRTKFGDEVRPRAPKA
jgi:monoamine oxidase